MQSYGLGFARIYNQKWSAFAKQLAPLIQGFYETFPIARENKVVLDLCCGTGQLAVHFLEQGYRVIGIDLSQPMLQIARENARQWVEAGQATFLQADATDFRLDEPCGLVVSTFDSLNHLANEQALRSCFQRVYQASEGTFICDLNTRVGLRRWNSINIDDSSDEALIIARGVFDSASDRAWTRITGFTRTQDGLYERFDETAFNTVFDLARVKNLLLEAGWSSAYFARPRTLGEPIEEPEAEGRAFIVASKLEPS
jgi:SAM-dependent methyltransferase